MSTTDADEKAVAAIEEMDIVFSTTVASSTPFDLAGETREVGEARDVGKAQETAFVFVKLPDELVAIVRSYMRDEWFGAVNHSFYRRLHSLQFMKLLGAIDVHSEKRCIQQMIQKDMNLVFAQWIERRFCTWTLPSKLTYKGQHYACVLDMLHEKCIEHDADRCRNALRAIAHRHGHVIKKTKRTYSW